MKRWGTEIIIEVEDVIRPDKITDYKRELEIIWHQFIHISNNLTVIDKIINFPFHLFLPKDERTFWTLTSKAYFDSTILALTTVLDEGNKKQSITLRGFKNKVLNPKVYRLSKVEPEVERILHTRLKDTNFENKIRPYQAKLKDIRNQRIAHLDLALVASPSDAVRYSLGFQELKMALDISNSLFQVLGLDTNYILDFWGYGNSHNETDIERILDMIALQSKWFRHWDELQQQYEKLNPNDKVIIDEWRNRLL